MRLMAEKIVRCVDVCTEGGSEAVIQNRVCNGFSLVFDKLSIQGIISELYCTLSMEHSIISPHGPFHIVQPDILGLFSLQRRNINIIQRC